MLEQDYSEIKLDDLLELKRMRFLIDVSSRFIKSKDEYERILEDSIINFDRLTFLVPVEKISSLPVEVNFFKYDTPETLIDRLSTHNSSHNISFFIVKKENENHTFLCVKVKDKIFILDSARTFYDDVTEFYDEMYGFENFNFIRKRTQADLNNCGSYAMLLLNNFLDKIISMKTQGCQKLVDEFYEYLSSYFKKELEGFKYHVPESIDTKTSSVPSEFLPPEMAVINQSTRELEGILPYYSSDLSVAAQKLREEVAFLKNLRKELEVKYEFPAEEFKINLARSAELADIISEKETEILKNEDDSKNLEVLRREVESLRAEKKVCEDFYERYQSLDSKITEEVNRQKLLNRTRLQHIKAIIKTKDKRSTPFPILYATQRDFIRERRINSINGSENSGILIS